MTDLVAYAQFTESKVGATGLTVTVDVKRITRATGASTQIVTGGSATELWRGVYSYLLSGADLVQYDYVFAFSTADTDVDQQEVVSLWTSYSAAYATELARIDAAITSRLAPTVAGNTLDVSADGAVVAAQVSTGGVSAASFSADVPAFFQSAVLDADNDAYQVAGSVGKNIKDSAVGVASLLSAMSTLVSDIWSYATRTLTSFASLASLVWSYGSRTLTEPTTVSPPATVRRDGSPVIHRGDNWAYTVSGCSGLDTYDHVDFMAKSSYYDDDSAAIIHIRLTAGVSTLVTLNGAPADDTSLGAIVVDSVDTLTVTLAPGATSQLAPASGTPLKYEVQRIAGANVETFVSGNLFIDPDVIRAIV
jgi:hypothetical protein